MELTLSQRIILRYYRTKIKTIGRFSPRKAAQYTLELFFTPYMTHRRAERPAIFHKAEPLSFRFNNYTIKGHRWAAPHNGTKTVLVCHGMNSCSYRFEKYILLLLQKNVNVLAFDAQAHGQSEGNILNAVIYSEIIEAIEAKFGALHGIIAHSLAGMGTAFYLERKKDALPKAALIAPATETVSAVNNYFRMLRLDDDFRKIFDDMVTEIRGLPPEWYSVSRAIREINNPVLWIHDEDDLICPYADAKAVGRLNLPHLQFIATKGLGHNKIYRDKKVQKQVLDFICS